jgi:hypothetical protein
MSAAFTGLPLGLLFAKHSSMVVHKLQGAIATGKVAPLGALAKVASVVPPSDRE